MNGSTTLFGPERKPASGNAPEQLVIFLHGLGADGNDLIGLADMLAEPLPNAHFVSPNAPFACDMAIYGYQWFTFQDRSPEALLQGIQQAAPILNEYIDQQLKRFNLPEEKLALIGFSQGSMMALHVALRRKQPCAGVVAYSGALIAPELLATELTASPQVCLIHGEADDVVPFVAFEEALKALQTAHVPTHAFSRDKLGHGIDPAGLQIGTRFLQSVFSHQEFMVG